MTKQVDPNAYNDFVRKVPSGESYPNADVQSMIDIETTESGMKVNAASLLTGAVGLFSEGGEFAEIVKKCISINPMDDETIFYCKRELGDIMWYWITSCRSLGLDPNEVIAENVEKLKSRYPDGEFDVYYSENRKEGDL